MSTAEELLTSAHIHTHPVPDTDTYFIIDPITRKIENTNRKKTVVMQYDHNSERFTFQLPRYIDGHDMLECTSVTVNADNIEAETGTTNSDAPDMTDLRLNPDDPETVISSWSITRELTQLAGILSFSIEYKCADSEGNVVYEWSTDTFDEIEVRARKKNGEAAVIEYTDLLEQWRTRIFGAGDSVMANIAAEGEVQVTAVNSEGAIQVAAVKMESESQQDAIELKGMETSESIPEDYTETNNMADEAVRTKSDAIVCESDGEFIMLTDSSDDYIRGLKMYGKSSQFTTTGKNKLNLGEQTERIVNGITLTPVYDSNGNLSYLNVNGTSTSTFILLSVPFSITAGSYTFTNFIGRTVEDGTLHAQICDSNSGLMYPQDMGLGGDFTFEEDLNLIYRIYIAEGRAVNNERIYPMLRLSSVTDTTYEPYTGGMPAPNPNYPQEIVSLENVTIDIHTDNLLKEPTIGSTTTYNGITCTYEGNGIYHFTGTREYITEASSFVNLWVNLPVERNAKYTLSAKLVEGTLPDTFHPYIGLSSDTKPYMNWITVHAEPSMKVGSVVSYTNTPAAMLPDAKLLNRFWIYLYNNTQDIYNVDFKIQVWVNKDTVSTEYTPYVKQPLALTQTLYGIPVTSGGNYTDSDGQQWVCDEIDLERGVYVQRVKRLVLDGSEMWRVGSSQYFYIDLTDYAIKDGNGFCSHFDYWYNYAGDCLFATDKWLYIGASLSNKYGLDVDAWKTVLRESPTTVQYILATPIETPLTAEEITAFKSLRTNHPNTTILNDAGAWMSVKYNADTKSYIENPKILKLTDSSTGVVYELKIVDGVLTVVPV